ncbi:MAG: cell division protein ZapA [Elusimicrobiota bacterium]|nr:cell division protein ZapA [Elusimicrobiota bacterium]MDH5662138.1 cell division protein ZapA [Elusimicrobiota bacterium]
MLKKDEYKIPVKIYNREFIIEGGNWDPLYISALAKYVDEQMNRIANTSNIVDTSRVAVLAALNIADELFRLRESKDTSGQEISKRSDELVKLLDQALKK